MPQNITRVKIWPCKYLQGHFHHARHQKSMKILSKIQLPVCLTALLLSTASLAHAQTTNPAPFVIPAHCEHGRAERAVSALPKTTVLTIDPAFAAALTPYARTFLNDLKLLRPGNNFALKTGKPARGEIYFTLKPNDAALHAEGYALNIGDFVTVQGKDARGAFWATRTLLQMLEQSPTLPKGRATDYPQFAVRGFVLDVGRKFFTLEFLRDYVKFMSYYKMNDFQIHLNDNGFKQFFGNDWKATYSAFRLESTTYPNLTAKDGSYSKQEFIDLQKLAESYGVNIVPEIDTPAHSLAFVKAIPEIGSDKYGSDHLDITKPRTREVIDNVFKEYLQGPNPVFRGPDVHIGTDEYAKAEAEAFRAYTDHTIRYVESFGKKVRMWGALTHAAGTTPVKSQDVTMNLWYNGYADPKAMFAQGFDGISTPDGWLYIVPKAGYYFDYLNGRNLYNNWTPNRIGDQTFAENQAQIKGGAFAVWNDHVGNGITEKDVHDRVFPALQVLAQKMWDGTQATKLVAYEDFARQSRRLGEGPGLNIRGQFAAQNSPVLRYDFERNFQDDSAARRPGTVARNVVMATHQDKRALWLTGENSFVTTPLRGIGYDYTVAFFVNPDRANADNAVLFSSPDSIVKLKQGASGKLGFSRENYDYQFDYAVPPNQWTHLAISGDNTGTRLYVNGVLREELKDVEVSFPGTKDKMLKVQTLFFPLQTIGAPENGFRGYLDEIQVFNRILSPENVANLAQLRRVEIEPQEQQSGVWKSGEIGDAWTVKEWEITPQIHAAGNMGVRFQYTGGEHRLDIASVELLQNGVVVARDEHAGSTGGTTKDNVYRLTLPTYKARSKYLLRARVRADGGDDSNGEILVTAR